MSQPFADLIVSGKKRIELRNWNTRFRGEFLVHAPLKIRRDDARRLRIDGGFVTGAVIGKAEIFGVKKYETEAQLRRDRSLHFAAKCIRGRYGFMLKNAKTLRIPVPCKGQLGFFEVKIPKEGFSEDHIRADIMDEECRYRWVNRH